MRRPDVLLPSGAPAGAHLPVPTATASLADSGAGGDRRHRDSKNPADEI